MARELSPLRRDKPVERERRHAISLNYSIGEQKWRLAAMCFMSTLEHLRQLDAGIGPTGRVVKLCPFRAGSDELLKEYGHRSQACREAAISVLFAPAPSPRELANKVKLLAFVEGLADPTAWDRTKAIGWSPMEEALGQLFLDAAILDQYHDAERYSKRGKRGKRKR